MTKLNGKCIRREMTVPGIRRPIIIELDEATHAERRWEKGSRTHYELPELAVYTVFVQHGKVCKK